MSRRSDKTLVPRNGHTMVVGIVARISGCQNQKELSLDDQEDHAKEEVADLHNGPAEYRVVATKGKGERLDRPELRQIQDMIRSRELDVLVMEDVGRLVRGTDAVRLWGIAVDHGVRCIAPNDCLDTVDETWEEDLISACRDHVGHNAHTSKRIKKKLMNRFRKFGGATALPIAGYIKPEGAKTYFDWFKVEATTETIVEGLELLKRTLNCSEVAAFFNSKGFSTGPYARNQEWDGHMVRRYYGNRLLAGYPGRGFRHTIKHNESGRRISVKNTDADPAFIECPHLVHVDAAELEEVNRLLVQANANSGRKKSNGVDPCYRRPRKRTKFPGQFARCWYCGHHYVWGGNGMTGNLMCSNSRRWHCWNSIGFSGGLATARIVQAIVSELHKLDGFDAQFQEIVSRANQRRSGGSAERWQSLVRNEQRVAREKDNLMQAIRAFGPRAEMQGELDKLDASDAALQQERRYLESLRNRELTLPRSVAVLREMFEQELASLAIDSPEMGTLLQQVVPSFHVYLVRLCDGGHLLPRARIELNLAGHVADAESAPELRDALTRVLTVDLFERPPQRERIREEAVRLAEAGVPQRVIARQLRDENPKQPVVQQALVLDRKIRELGLESPYLFLGEPPDDYSKLRRHKNPRYRFQGLDDYEPPRL